MLNFLRRPTSRIFWIVLVGYLFLCLFFTVWSYYRQCAQAEQSALLRLEGIAKAIALQIDGDAHAELTKRYIEKDALIYNQQDSNYAKIHHTLRANAEANNLETPIYSLIFSDSAQCFEFVVTSSDNPYFRHKYESYPQVLSEKYKKGGFIPMFADKFGTWLSAFEPVRNMHGEVVAVVMVDEKFSNFIARARMEAWRSLGLSLVIVAPVVLLLVFLLRRMLAREIRLKKNLEQTQTALAASFEQLASVDNLRKEMIANISHDLRTPLTVLSGYIETLYMRRHNISLEERTRFLTIAQKESGHLRKLIDDLFDLSKLETNQMPVHAEPMPILELLHDLAGKYQLLCAEQNLEFQLKLPEGNPWIVAEWKLIARVLQNLLDNAIRYNNPQGFVRIEAQGIDNQLFISVENSGKKIPDDVIKQIFDRYFKSSDMESSTGLGLAIVKKIIELHQSNITVQSSEEKTQFQFWLPIYQREEA
jgi:signal transduction histidine kinase